MKITVQITRGDITKGQRNCSTFCPIALALNRVFPGKCVEVYGSEVHVYEHKGNGRTERVIALGRDAQNFVIDFDSGSKVEPFEFTIEAIT